MIVRAGWSRENAILSDQRGGKEGPRVDQHNTSNNSQNTIARAKQERENKRKSGRENLRLCLCLWAQQTKTETGQQYDRKKNLEARAKDTE